MIKFHQVLGNPKSKRIYISHDWFDKLLNSGFLFKESALRPILSSSRNVYIFIYISVPFHVIYFEASHWPTPVTWSVPRPVIGLTIGPQFHQEIAGGPLQSSALQSPDRVQDSEEQNYEEVHLQSEISLQYPDERKILVLQPDSGTSPPLTNVFKYNYTDISIKVIILQAEAEKWKTFFNSLLIICQVCIIWLSKDIVYLCCPVWLYQGLSDHLKATPEPKEI